ncbi:hypothetical protein WKR88_26035 [Trinickia caryophylli]|uniref:Putative baseplate assembly protein n=1 Tax=Trinickia caryophylli TaxID=28094 RepID=A0A1X7GAB5_TRICW|nr:hypothetical protein [Trinickia caryophylli]PMS11353.1 hypothetical protein C0Z17_14495 [Trinickia caryophylli]TRX17546.1 hypothetical protein FNF07_04415 [Trinickia caryophylli]WQE11707.1 hypothetical protein U0034_18505 [Trinickia caryophylli]SMF66666.1 putative baseplate assembly protein [Trinickia caryophylli]GLU34892.1 hypothetical protein Busp01_47340 [Trinickia caryophylli]
MSTPIFDQRTASAYFADALALARMYCPEWGLPDDDGINVDAVAQDPGLVLLKLFSLLGQGLANVQNAIPMQRQLALYRFLDMTLRPAACASVPLWFSLASNKPSMLLPKGTAVLDSSTRRVRFETDADLQVLPTALCAALRVTPRLDRYQDMQALWAGGEPAAIFPGGGLRDDGADFGHALLLGDGVLFKPGSAASRMTLTLRGQRLAPAYFQRWYDGALSPLPVTVWGSADATLCTIEFASMPNAAAQTVAALHAALSLRAGRSLDLADPSFADDMSTPIYWLVCEPAADAGVVPALDGYLPRIETAWCDFGMLSALPQQAAVNGIGIDLKNGAYAFGRTPAVNDCFSIRCDCAFAQPGVPITMTLTVSPPTTQHQATVEWQYWNGAWCPFAQTGDSYRFVDETQDLTASGTISFVCPRMSQTTVVGSQGLWIRAMLTSGDYGDSTTGFDPPFVQSMVIEYASGGTPASVWAHNAFQLDAQIVAPYEPYRPLADEGAALYLGFDAPGLLAYGLGQQLTLYFDVEPADEHLGTSDAGQWQWFDVSNGAWQPLAIDVADVGLARSGALTFSVPAGLRAAAFFSQTACWLRVLCPRRRHPLRLRGLYPNAVGGSNRSICRNEVLGSSNGQPGQQFALSQVATTAAGASQVLLEMGSDAQYAVEVQVVEPASPDSTVIGSASPQQRIAYAWSRADSFVGHGPDERIFVVDVISGAIVFGDGHHGKIPPPGANNVIATCYATTLGAGGNVAAGELAVLYNATTGILHVTNPVSAHGGADADRVVDLVGSGPGLVRANDRAVTAADAEALARVASAAVARVRAIEHAVAPMLAQEAAASPISLQPNNGPAQPAQRVIGHWPRLELVVLAASNDPEPLTPMSTLDDVLTYVRARSTPALAARTTARRPSFRRIDVAVVLETNAPKSAWAPLKAEIGAQLTRFLHPVRGGPAAKGWPIGEPMRYPAVRAFLLASNTTVTGVMALALCGLTTDVPLAPYEAPAAGAIDVRFLEAAQS